MNPQSPCYQQAGPWMMLISCQTFGLGHQQLLIHLLKINRGQLAERPACMDGRWSMCCLSIILIEWRHDFQIKRLACIASQQIWGLLLVCFKSNLKWAMEQSAFNIWISQAWHGCILTCGLQRRWRRGQLSCHELLFKAYLYILIYLLLPNMYILLLHLCLHYNYLASTVHLSTTYIVYVFIFHVLFLSLYFNFALFNFLHSLFSYLCDFLFIHI